jgi:ABC-type branched-subunit amino acid transport system substrate-binding protein
LALTVAALAMLAACTTVSRTSITAGGGSGPSAAGSSVGSSGSPSGGPAASCDKTLKIGINLLPDMAAMAGMMGGAIDTGGAEIPADTGKIQSDAYQQVVNEINNTGGLGGCQVEVVLHTLDLAGGTLAAESQAACSDLAEDKKVFAVIPAGAEDGTMVSCLAEHKVITFQSMGLFAPTNADYEKFKPYLYGINSISPDRFGSFIDRFDAAGFFGDDAKVGILINDNGTGSNQLLAKVWKEALEAKNISVSEFTYPSFKSAEDIGSVTTAFGSGVLQFKGEGVNRVLFTLDAAGSLFFPSIAEGQGFRPRYGMTSASTLAGLSAAPDGQREGAVGISYQTTDLISLSNLSGGGAPEGLEANPTRERCDKLFADSATELPAGFTFTACEPFFLMQKALEGVSEVTPETLREGIDKLGDSYPLSSAYGNASFANGRSDGAAYARTMKWDPAMGDKGSWAFATEPELVP